MKHLSKFVITRTGLISLIGLGGLIFAVAFANFDHTVKYKSVESKISLSSINMVDESTLQANNVLCEAEAELNNEQLSDISAFSFSIPINQLKHQDPQVEQRIQQLLASKGGNTISFTKKYAMVLSTMKMVHIIGELTIGNTSKPIAFQFSFDFGSNKELIIKGKQAISLSDFGIIIPDELKSQFKNEFNLDLSAPMLEKNDTGV